MWSESNCSYMFVILSPWKSYLLMRGSRKFCQRGPTLSFFFLVVERRKDPNTTICGPTSACQRNASGPTFNASLVALCFFKGSGPLLLSPILLWFFRGGGGGGGGGGGSGPPVPLWIRTCFLPGNGLQTNPLIRNLFYFSIKQQVFSYSRKKT